MGTFPFGKVIIALIVLMVVAAGVGLYLGSEESAPPPTTPTTPTPTPTTITTQMPPPTTPTPPYTDPTPTPTPTPTIPQLTPEELAYKITIEHRKDICVQARNALSELMANPQISDSGWRGNVVVQLALIKAVYNEAIGLDPPSSMAAIHGKYIQALNHYETAATLITQGMEKLDVNLLEQATVELLIGDQLLTETIELLNEFIVAHST